MDVKYLKSKQVMFLVSKAKNENGIIKYFVLIFAG